MQEQVEQNVREKAELQRELDLIADEKEALKRLLEKQRQEAVSLKVPNSLLDVQRRVAPRLRALTATVCSCRVTVKRKTKKTSN